MKNELLFISNCFNLYYNKLSLEKIEELTKKELYWDFILKKLIQSDIAPLAFHNLSIIKNNEIPKQFLDSLNNIYNYTIVKNIFIEKALEEILNAFYMEGIPVIPLKGAFMIGALYENIALRPLGDIDLLIKERDLDKIDAILLKNAYIKIKKDLFTVSYIKKKTLVELHYKLNLPLSLSIPHDFIWENALPEKIDNMTISYPSLEDAVIYSALHFSHHLSEAILCLSSYPGLKSILDIHEIISRKKESISWDYIIDASKKYKITAIVYSALYLSKLYFNTDIPWRRVRRMAPILLRRKVLEIFLLNKYLWLIAVNDKSEILLRRFPHAASLVYSCLFEEDCFKEKPFLCSVRKFAEKHYLPYPSFRAYFLYSIRIFLFIFIKMLLLANRESAKP